MYGTYVAIDTCRDDLTFAGDAVIVMWEADKDQIRDALMQAINVSHVLQHKHAIQLQAC
jgi:hypothetical protein